MKKYLEMKRRKRNLLIALAIYVVMIIAAVVAIKTKDNEDKTIFRTVVGIEWVLMVPAMYIIFKNPIR